MNLFKIVEHEIGATLTIDGAAAAETVDVGSPQVVGKGSWIRGISVVFDGSYPNGPAEFTIEATVDGVQHAFTRQNLAGPDVIIDTGS